MGQGLVEFALVTPILLVLMLAAIDFGRYYYAKITVSNAAREGAAAAAVTPGTSSGVDAATREAQGSLVTVDATDVVVSCDPSCTKSYGTQVTVRVEGHFQVLTPLIWVFTGGSNVTLASQATADVVVVPAAAGVPPTPTPDPSATPTPTPDPSATPTPTPTPSPSPTPTCAPPAVGFTYTQQNKNKPVEFTSTSTPTTGPCAINYWRWEFGDGATDAGNLSSVSHDYGNANQGRTFSVTLTVTTPGGTYAHVGSVTTRS